MGKNAVGRGWYQEGRYVGYVVPNRGLIISYRGKEIVLKQYEVFIGDSSQYRWLGWYVLSLFFSVKKFTLIVT